MVETLKKFKSFWLIELFLLAAGFYFIYDGFVADDAKFKIGGTSTDSSVVTEKPVTLPPTQMTKTILETAVVCLDVDARKKKPLMAKGRFSKYIDKLYCFTEISGAMPDALIHDWVYENGRAVRQTIKLNGETKVWSEMTMSPDKAGSWRVDILTGDGTLLYTADFILK